MGQWAVAARIDNAFDIESRERGLLLPGQVRSVDVTDALVDTGATSLLLPKRLVAQLGLRQFRTRTAKGIGGTVPMPMYSAVRLTLEGRECTLDVGEIADEYPVMIGQVPLELLDLVVDLKGGRLIPNPAHGGEHVMDVF